MIIKPIVKGRGYAFMWLALFILSLFMPCAAQAVKVEGQPGNAVVWRGSSTSIVYAVVTGRSDGGGVWGSGPYTDDSYIPTAAVHSGTLADGEIGLVKITILPGQSSYSASTNNGVTTNEYGSWYGSYSLSRWNYDGTTIEDPINFVSWDGMLGTFNISLTGTTSGNLWGTDIYTSDSTVALAAVHAGKLAVGQSAVVPVTLLEGLSSYTGSTRNGVSSVSYGSWNTSYTFGTTPTCIATINNNSLFYMPYISYVNPLLGNIAIWADFAYEFNPTYIIFKLTNYAVINNPSFSCAASTLANDLTIHVPDVLLPDGKTHLWADLIYSSALSTGGNFYWVVSNYGVVSN